MQYRVDMWKSCTVDAVVADGFALTGGAKLCARLCFVENRASRYSWSESEANTTEKPAPRRNSGQR